MTRGMPYKTKLLEGADVFKFGTLELEESRPRTPSRRLIPSNAVGYAGTQGWMGGTGCLIDAHCIYVSVGIWISVEVRQSNYRSLQAPTAQHDRTTMIALNKIFTNIL